jgi:predicted dehydrogenase
MNKLTRRDFARATVVAGVATALSHDRILGANDRIRLGFIGSGNRGDQVLDAFLAHKDAEVVAICDLYQPYLDFASKKIGTNPKQSKDYKALLDMKDIDATVVCTPDHWHALQTIHACEAGKDVYVEKPLSLYVAEGRKMVEAARKYKRVTQVGLNRRSHPTLKEAVELARGGAIGKITAVRSFHIHNEWPKGIGNPPDGTPPADVDWDTWLGPAPKVPYNKNRTFYRFRWFWDYSGGQVTNFGTHYLDVIQWVLGHDAPLAVTVMGGKLAIEDNREVPDTLEALWTYPGGTLVTFSQFNTNATPVDRRNCNMEFRGTKGTLYLTWNGYEVVPEEISDKEVPALTPLNRRISQDYESGRKLLIKPKKVEGEDSTPQHARNFLDCVRSRQLCNCDIEIGHRSTTATLIANIAYRTKSYLEWDSRTESFRNAPKANQHLSYKYRAPYKLPEI